MSNDLFKGLGVPVQLIDNESFLKIKETLTRIGVASKNNSEKELDGRVIVRPRVLYQSVHVLHKQGTYAILHFKELFMLDGRPSDLSSHDVAKRNTIAFLLEDWGLLKINNKEKFETNLVDLRQIKIITHAEKNDWILTPKYTIGNKRNYNA